MGVRSKKFGLIESLERRQLLTAVSSTLPLNGARSVPVSSDVTITFDRAMNASTLTSETVVARDNSGNILAAGYSYNSTTRTLTVNPTSNFPAGNGYITVRVLGGNSGIKGVDQTPLARDLIFAFSTGGAVFTETSVYSGLNAPVAVNFASDGRVFVAERRGVVKVFDSLSDTTPTTVIDIRTNTHNYWDRGLLGMQLDPNFPSNPSIYLLYAYDGLVGQNAPRYGAVNGDSDGGGTDPLNAGSFVTARLSKFTLSGTTASAEQVLIHDWPMQYPSHAIGDLAFGPDGMLYASAGDGASFGFVDWGQNANPFNDPVNEGGALRSQDILSSGDPTQLDGTIIRVDPATGLGVAGNPFFNSSDINNRRIIAWGLRNPYRMGFKPETDELFIADTGWNSFEEINRISDVNDSIAENFGWPAYEGVGRQSGYDNQNLPLLEGLYNTPNAVTSPFYAYSHSERVVPGSSEPTGGSSPTGIAFYERGSYPVAYDGALFFADYSRRQIYVMYKGPDGQPLASTRQIFRSTANGIVQTKIGPGGDLFAVDMNGGRIYRYATSGFNRAPTAFIDTNRTSGTVPLSVTFDARNSTDPDDNQVLSYTWDLNGDGTFGDSTAANPTFTYTTPGDYVVSLRVTDSGGLSDVETVLIAAGNTPPTPVISAPATSFNWSVGQTINFAGSASDSEDGQIPASSLRWDVILVHGNEIDPGNTHTHGIQSFSGVASGSFIGPDHEAPSWIELRLTATDSRGLSSIVTRRIDPQTVTLNFNSSTPGLSVSFNGTNFVTPVSRIVNVGSTNSVSAITPQVLGNSSYLFDGWSNGSPASFTLIAPQSNATFIATYGVAQLNRLTGNVIGSVGSQGSDPNRTRDAAFDGNTSTFFDGPATSNGNGLWAGLDLGSARTIGQIRHYPRTGFENRMVGGRFQGSNDPTFATGVVDIFNITQQPATGQFTPVTVNPSTIANGLTATYFNSRTLTGTLITRIDPAVDFNWGTSSPSTLIPVDNFSSRWTGQVQSNEGGNYEFRVLADDGVRLWVNDQLVIDRWVDQGATQYVAAVNLPAFTRVNIKMEYYENGGDAVAQLAWRRPSQSVTEVIPTANLFASAPSGGGAYRYVRYLSPDAGWGNVSELEFYTAVSVVAPAAPGSLVGTAIAAGIALSWTDNSSNETGFAIERRVSSTAFAQVATVGAGVTNFTDGTVAPSTTYEYRVKAIGSSGESGYSNVASVTSVAPPTGTAPTAPGAVTATATAADRISLGWTDNSNNETQFSIERRAGTSGSFAQIGTVPSNITTFVDTTVIASTSYQYRILAINSFGSAASTNASVTTPAGAGVPNAPTGLGAVFSSTPSVTLTWTDNASNETGYSIERRFAGWIWETIGTASVNAFRFIDTNPIRQVTYEYRVRATGATQNSDYSNLVSVETISAGSAAPNAPSALTASPANATRVDLSWEDNSSNETSFRIERRTLGGTFALLVSVAANARTYADLTTSAGVAYQYRIFSINGSLSSTESNTASVTTPGGVGVPNTPTGLSGVVETRSPSVQVRLNWTDNSSNENGFEIQRRFAGWIWESLGSTGANAATYLDTTSIGAVIYEYRVLALGPGGNSPFSNGAIVSTIG